MSRHFAVMAIVLAACGGGQARQPPEAPAVPAPGPMRYLALTERGAEIGTIEPDPPALRPFTPPGPAEAVGDVVDRGDRFAVSGSGKVWIADANGWKQVATGDLESASDDLSLLAVIESPTSDAKICSIVLDGTVLLTHACLNAMVAPDASFGIIMSDKGGHIVHRDGSVLFTWAMRNSWLIRAFPTSVLTSAGFFDLGGVPVPVDGFDPSRTSQGLLALTKDGALARVGDRRLDRILDPFPVAGPASLEVRTFGAGRGFLVRVEGDELQGSSDQLTWLDARGTEVWHLDAFADAPPGTFLTETLVAAARADPPAVDLARFHSTLDYDELEPNGSDEAIWWPGTARRMTLPSPDAEGISAYAIPLHRCFSPDGHWLFAGGAAITRYDFETGAPESLPWSLKNMWLSGVAEGVTDYIDVR